MTTSGNTDHAYAARLLDRLDPDDRDTALRQLRNLVADREHPFRTTAATTPLTPCPSWCEEPAGHPWEPGDDDFIERVHSRTRTVDSLTSGPDHTTEVKIDYYERRVSPDMEPGLAEYLTTNQTFVQVNQDDWVDPAGIRRVVAALIEAAELIEQTR